MSHKWFIESLKEAHESSTTNDIMKKLPVSVIVVLVLGSALETNGYCFWFCAKSECSVEQRMCFYKCTRIFCGQDPNETRSSLIRRFPSGGQRHQ
ncbi:uncharacterized protein LOC143225270 isoform X4 [Tachypleus tridentatus]|uniref:uncharacterized protein LOC143225270 isoform X4 n=1 Tax=Tachypleus tridentatus TaxID=6853 RepID=UPI003FD471B4